MTENLAALLYLVASVCFIMALKGLSSPETARHGNFYGIAGMVLAIGTTLALPIMSGYIGIAIAIVIGGAVGTFIALRIQMTALPQLVAAFHSLVGLAAVYGIGYGGYQSVDWALAIDVLPGRADAGKDMGIWHTALVLPIVIAPPMTGIILNSVKHVSLPGAYSAMFLTSAAWFALGTALVSQVKRVR